MPGTLTSIGALMIGLAYVLGSIPTAVLVCNSMGIADPRQQGSGNPGATNVLRIGNRTAAALTLLGDIAKGALAVGIAQMTDLTGTAIGLCALAAVMGHLYPIQGVLHGGKGVSTTLGVSLMLSPLLALCQISSWLVCFALTRISSAASLVTALLTPLFAWFVIPELLGILTLIMLLLVARHARNIRNLLQHREPKL
ncbi:Acyl-phosphate:glycerol-3-phosphate O-acyltransferase PlsY [Marinobacterium lacunae]|uniref:Glycerol-3-phosphate acyltransferase n=1 Tax=Marinobacterium lacunae TaxID=1232683 RepID=A0A081G099_9GAMM|nr:glycerol-3-phosphate 1-O-acyltransferase PlsY [Marinobacterium lacunae]KEA64204.1 Acyl-phosphate:glycerol-3-phosphate O-acyltransferase PlsY [Marinobacterium lacunae]